MKMKKRDEKCRSTSEKRKFGEFPGTPDPSNGHAMIFKAAKIVLRDVSCEIV